MILIVTRKTTAHIYVKESAYPEGFTDDDIIAQERASMEDEPGLLYEFDTREDNMSIEIKR